MTRENAIRHGKAQTESRCVFTGTTGVDGAHWYSAGDFPALADVPENIFAMYRECHSMSGLACFDFKQVEGVDTVRSVAERRWLLENITLDDLLPMVRKKIHVVGMWCKKLGVEFPDAIQPSDYYALRLRGREC